MVLITRSMTDLRFLVHLVLLYETAEAKARSFDTGASSEANRHLHSFNSIVTRFDTYDALLEKTRNPSISFLICLRCNEEESKALFRLAFSIATKWLIC